MPLNFLKSCRHATRGILISIKNERNMRIHVLAIAIVLGLSLIMKIQTTDFIIVVLLIGMVIGAEMFNTAAEKICNILRDNYKLPYEGSRDIRDIAAGAVWVQAIIALVIGFLIFGSYLFK